MRNNNKFFFFKGGRPGRSSFPEEKRRGESIQIVRQQKMKKKQKNCFILDPAGFWLLYLITKEDVLFVPAQTHAHCVKTLPAPRIIYLFLFIFFPRRIFQSFIFICFTRRWNTFFLKCFLLFCFVLQVHVIHQSSSRNKKRGISRG